MKRTISISNVYPVGITNQLVIGTHSGVFHADDVIAVALFCINNPESDITIIRSRENSELSKCDILVDIGGGKYDHHQKGGNGSRDDGTPYASAGLFWKYHGREIIDKLANNDLNFMPTPEEIDEIFTDLDNELFKEIDNHDNGHSPEPTTFDYIDSFLPNWRVVHKKNVYDECFEKVLFITIDILKQVIYKYIDDVGCYSYIRKMHNKAPKSRILQIPSQTFPWQETVTLLNDFYNANIDFVVFKYYAGGWAAQCVPPSIGLLYEQRISFPESWAGQTTDLPEISGIHDATFCHNNRFFIRAKSYDSIIAMCNIAMNT